MSDGKSQKYRKPPILEAVIEFRFAAEVPLSAIKKASKKLEKYYDTNQTEKKLHIHANISDGGREIKDSEHDLGQRLTSSDSAEVTVLHRDKFLIARLAPYPGWDEFYERVERDWSVWYKQAGYNKISRIGVRFVNRIDIPLDVAAGTSLHEFLTVYPLIPTIGPDQIDGYIVQISKPLGANNANVKIATATVDSPVPESASLLLDIDVFTEVDIPTKNDQLWALVRRFREHKNAVFEACITDKSRGLFS